MRWDDVIQAIYTEASADPALVAIHGNGIQAAGMTDHIVPGLSYRLITDTETELWEPMIVQWDHWTHTVAELVASERALRDLFDQDVEVTIQGVYMLSFYTEGSELGQAEFGPDRTNYFGRATRFAHHPIRESRRAGRSGITS
jgi:hypothetical protein